MSRDFDSYSNPRPLLQWSYLTNGKNSSDKNIAPSPSYLQSSTQIGSKILYYGGSNEDSIALSQLYIFDDMKWATTTNMNTSFQEDNAGARFGHTATLVQMHPPMIMIYGGYLNGGTFDFDQNVPDGLDDEGMSAAGGYSTLGGVKSTKSSITSAFWNKKNPVTGSKRQSRASGTNGSTSAIFHQDNIELDENVYFLTLHANQWEWKKPLVLQGNKTLLSTPSSALNHTIPLPRAEHTATKTNTNEVTIFGGWIGSTAGRIGGESTIDNEYTNDIWTFNVIDREWKRVLTQGESPMGRCGHTAEFIQNKLYILGGRASVGPNSNISQNRLGLAVLDYSDMRWDYPNFTMKHIGGSGGSNNSSIFPRFGHSSATIGAKSLLVFGGIRLASSASANGGITYLNDLLLCDIETMTYLEVDFITTTLPTPISYTAMNVIGNKVFVYGGSDQKGTVYNDLRSVDIGVYMSEDDITVNEGAISDYSFKIIIIGDTGVGKSALLTRFAENTFLTNYAPTIGIDFSSRMIRVDNAICKLEIWDTAGQERFSTMTANYYRGAQGAVLVYDLTQPFSFEHIENWFNRARQLGGEELVTILLGNKIDLINQRQVTTEQGKTLAERLNITHFIETSALNGENVEKAFISMTRQIKILIDSKGLNGIKNAKNLQTSGKVNLSNMENKNNAATRKSSCC